MQSHWVGGRTGPQDGVEANPSMQASSTKELETGGVGVEGGGQPNHLFSRLLGTEPGTQATPMPRYLMGKEGERRAPSAY